MHGTGWKSDIPLSSFIVRYVEIKIDRYSVLVHPSFTVYTSQRNVNIKVD